MMLDRYPMNANGHWELKMTNTTNNLEEFEKKLGITHDEWTTKDIEKKLGITHDEWTTKDICNYVIASNNIEWNTEPKDDKWGSTKTIKKETVEIPIVNHVHSVGPAFIVYWSDGSFTKAVCSKEDVWSYEVGFMVCFMKKILGKKRFYDSLKHVNDYVKFDIDHGNVDPKFYSYSEWCRKEREVAERKRAKKAKKRREKRIREMAEAYSIALASQKNVNPMEASQKRCARRTMLTRWKLHKSGVLEGQKKEESDQ